MNNVPFLLVYPAFHKTTQVYKYAGQADAVEMAKFIHKNAEIKFELKDKFFSAKEDPTSDAVMMEMGEDGNIAPNPEQIKELQAKQDGQEAQKAGQMQEVEDELKRRGEL